MAELWRKHGRRAVTAVLAAAVLVSCVMMARQERTYRESAGSYEEAAALAGKRRPSRPPAKEPEAEEAPEEAPAEREPPPEEASELVGLDLGALRAVNGDVEGWIEIPGTELSYPLMQGEDNRYYLNHTWKGEANAAGSIFLEQTASADLSDFHTLVYGHRMRNGSMFATLKYYKDLSYWREHPRVYILREGELYRYDIFSAFEAGVRGAVYRLDLEEKGLEEAFIQYCLERTVIETGIVPEGEDRLLTLSTCTGNGHATRWIVQARLAQVYGLEAPGEDAGAEEEPGGPEGKTA